MTTGSSLSGTDLNMALARALGIDDLSRVARIDLTLRFNEPPRVTVVRNVYPDPGAPARVEQVVQQFNLQLVTRPAGAARA